MPGQNIRDIFKSYNEQSGVPLITATRDGNTVTLTQKRFLIQSKDHEDPTKWNTKVTCAVTETEFENTIVRATYFPASQASVTITLPNEADFYVLNVQSFGYFRVNYDEANWKKIGEQLKKENFGGIHVLNRAQIIDDLFQLARAEYHSYDFIFTVLEYIQEERAYVPWTSFLNGLNYLQQRIPNDEYRANFEVSSTFDLLENYLISS